jgi:hypothetical protein
MDTTVKLGVVLLVDDDQGDVMAIRFRDTETARGWEDEHDLEIGTVRGVARVVTPAEALAEYQ